MLRELLRTEGGPELLVYITEDKGFILTDHNSVSIMFNSKPHYNKKVLLIEPKNITPAYKFLSSNIHTSIYEMAKKNDHMVDVEGKQIKLPKYRRRLKRDDHKQAVSKLQKKREKENQDTRDAMRILFAKRASKNIARRVLQPSGIELLNTIEYEPVDWEQKSFILKSHIFDGVCEYFYNQERGADSLEYENLDIASQQDIIEGIYLNKLIKTSISLPTEFYDCILESMYLFYDKLGGTKYIRFALTDDAVQMLFVEKTKMNLAVYTFPTNVNKHLYILKEKELVLKMPHWKWEKSDIVSNELSVYTDKEGNMLKATYDIIATKKGSDPCLIYLTLDLGLAKKSDRSPTSHNFIRGDYWGHVPSLESYHEKVVANIFPKQERLINLLGNYSPISLSVFNGIDMYFYVAFSPSLSFSPVYIILYIDNYSKNITQVTVKCTSDEVYNKFTVENFVEIISSLFFEKTTISEWQDKYSSENYIKHAMRCRLLDKNIVKVYEGKDTPPWSNRGKSIIELELCTRTGLSYVGVARLPNTSKAVLEESCSTLHYTEKTALYLKILGQFPVIFEDGPLKSRTRIPLSEMVIVHNLEHTKYISRLADLEFQDAELHDWNVLDRSWGVHKNKFKMEKHGPLPDLMLNTAKQHWDRLKYYSIAGYELGFRTDPFYNALFNIRK
tara:strand:- start:333 stop:2348 length:2016 start_codon:yes stop_codon:yes gene_type:complete